MAPSIPTTEVLSGISGSASLACWLFLLLPQLLENYRNDSAEAISLAFIFVWFIGDVCNLLGAFWAGLVPVVIAIAVYFCIADAVLIGQCLYYGIRNRRREGKGMLEGLRAAVSENGDVDRRLSTDEPDEQAPLLSRKRSAAGSITIPGSGDRRRSSAGSRRTGSGPQPVDEHLARILEERDQKTGARLWFKNTMSVIAIFAIGAIGWVIAYESGAWKATPPPGRGDAAEDDTPTGALILGYASAVAYLGARIPQIIKNYRDKSCEGLSLLFFILSLMGNLTYGAGILFHSVEKDYIMTNLPWLIGSFGTMIEDAIIFAQFRIYRVQEEDGSAIQS